MQRTTEDSKATKKWFSVELTNSKGGTLMRHAVFLRDCRNGMAEMIQSDLLFYIEMSKFDFYNHMHETYRCPEQYVGTDLVTDDNRIPNSFEYQQYDAVYTAHQNRFDAIKKKMNYKHRITTIKTYTRNSKKHRKGDKEITYTYAKSNNLSVTISYLAKCDKEDVLGYIKSQLASGTCTPEQVKKYNKILATCEKFTFERIDKVVEWYRKKVLSRYSNPIVFTSLTFSGQSRKKFFIDASRSEHKNSVVKAYADLSSIPGYDDFYIPLTYHTGYHGNLEDYKKPVNKYAYTIQFTGKKNVVCINYCIKCARTKPVLEEPSTNSNTVGFDVNLKHNMLSGSNGKEYDYDRKLVDKIVKTQQEIDDRKSKNKEYIQGKRTRKKTAAQRRSMKGKTELTLHHAAKDLLSEGVKHCVLEDLDNMPKTFARSKDNDMRISRLGRLVHLSDIKNIATRIFMKHGISVSTIPSEYTSQRCPVCGCIHEDNRIDQGHFECVNCGYKSNADRNASINIRNTITELDVQVQDELLEKLPEGNYRPRKLKHEKICKILMEQCEKQMKDHSSSVEPDSIKCGNSSPQGSGTV